MIQQASFGQWLKNKRKLQGLTQEDLAERTNCGFETIRKIEAGTRRPSRQMAELLAQALGIAEEEVGTFVDFARLGLSALKSNSSMESSEPRLGGLPDERTSFIGRAREIESVRNLLLHGNIKLLTLVGPPGIGKTRLSMRVAADLADQFEAGVCFVALDPITNPGMLAPTIVRAFGMQEVSSQSPNDRLKHYLRDKSLLLLLDNFEHITPAGPLVSELLAACPDLKIVVTSRTALRIYGEHQFPVPPLGLPDPWVANHLWQNSGAPEQYEALELFTERARAIQPDFTLTEDLKPTVAEICRQLDGLPLAIELAAARIKLLPPPAILVRLSSRLSLLTSGATDLPTRQRTLRGAIGWSYDLLDAEEKALFRRMSVFVGGGALEAAEAVCNIQNIGHGMSSNSHAQDSVHSELSAPPQFEVLDGLASLLDKSLIQRKEVEWGQARFSMLWTIREYALERLAMSGEGKHIRRQHALYYLSLAEAAEPHLTSTERGLWLQRLEREHDNLRAALSWCQSESGDAVIGLQLAGSLHWFWHFRGHTSEGRQWIESALERSDPSHRTAARAKALFAAARLAVLQCNDTTTLPRLSESVEIYRQLGETRALAHALIFLGIVKVLQGEKSGINCIEESVALFWEVRDDWGLACALDFLGDAEIMIGDLERANNLKEESLSLYRKLHDKGGTASQLGELGRVALQRGDYGAARSRLEEALTIQREVGDRWVIALTIRNLGDVAQLEGDYEKASAFYQESLSHFQELGEKMRMAAVLRSLGHVALHQGDHEHATSLYQESLELGEELGAQGRVILIYSLVGLAGIAAARQELDLAARLLACVEALHRPSSSTMARVDLSEYERNLASVRAQLSTPALVEAWQVGQAMTLEQALLAAQTVTHAPR